MSAGRTRVIFTGVPGSLAGLQAAVESEGGQYTEWPLLGFAGPADPASLEQAIGRLAEYAAICVTSPRAASAIARLVEQHDIDLTLAPVLWTSAACAPILRPLFPRVEVVAREHAAVGLGSALAETMLSREVGSPVLFPCGDLHRHELVTALRRAGRVVDVIEAYRTVLAPPSRALAVMSAADILVVTSPAVARLLAGVQHRERPALVAIGPTTAGEAQGHGWPPDAVAVSPEVPAVASAINSLLPSYS